MAKQVKLEPSRLYLPARLPAVTNAEVQKLEEIMPTELQKLDDIHSRTSGHQRTFDVDSLLHLHQTSSRRDKQLHWHLIINASICVVTILGIIICYYRSFLHNKWYTIFRRNIVQDPNTSKSNPQPELQNTTRDTTHEPVESERNVIFASYSMQTTKLTQHTDLHSICRNSFITNAALAILTFHNRHVILNTSWKSTRQTAARLKQTFNSELSRYTVYFVKLE